MLVKHAKINFIQCPFLVPVWTANGQLPAFESLILTLESNAGTGQAEITNTLFPDLDFSSFRTQLEEQVLPLLTDQSISDTQSLKQILGKWSRNPVVYALAEMAWFDLSAAEKGEPLSKVLGASPISQQVFTSLDQPELDADGYPLGEAFLDQVKQLYADGYVHLELKIRPGWDTTMLRNVRQDNPDASFHVDFEGALGIQNYDTLLLVRDFFPYMIEQPFAADELVEHAELQKMLHSPVCLDESVLSPGMISAALHLESAKNIKINPLRAGGFERAKEILAICREAGIDCWISSPISTGTAVRSNLAFSCLEGFTGPFEYYDLRKYFAQENLEGMTLPPELVLDEENTLRIE